MIKIFHNLFQAWIVGCPNHLCITLQLKDLTGWVNKATLTSLLNLNEFTSKESIAFATVHCENVDKGLNLELTIDKDLEDDRA